MIKESLKLGPKERGEIVFEAHRPIREPILHVRCRGGEVIVEEILHGRASVMDQVGGSSLPIEFFRNGIRFEVTITREEPIKLIVINSKDEPSLVTASLTETEGLQTKEEQDVR